jgi:hypothetical protein
MTINIPLVFNIEAVTDENGLISIEIPIPAGGRWFSRCEVWSGENNIAGDKIIAAHIKEADGSISYSFLESEFPEGKDARIKQAIGVPPGEIARFGAIRDDLPLKLSEGQKLCATFQAGDGAQGRTMYADLYWIKSIEIADIETNVV